ncbi:hypothetical protein OG217_05535 [Streptomyces sp. NBC_01023]|uniref:hypothetical protein n=1 Tax=Streptomyces sp. NBC_01023 TaxID=2903724 RepID=UPI00386A98A3|nr:hypothetical protein OG217_05535 [Streptomyces sp. NBC_01023]
MADPFLVALDQATRTVVARVRGELPQVASTGAAIAHTYCCEPDWSLCGVDLSDLATSGNGDQECVVCVDLLASGAVCPGCQVS